MKKLLGFMLAVFLLPMAGAARGGDFDWDGDGDVDLDDYAEFPACLLGPTVPLEAGCEPFDGDIDNDVDLFDFYGFQLAFTGPLEPVVTVRTQLAGNSLSEYPFFEYVKAFNEDSTVEVAIDPTRFPDIVGRTCDIYVVEAKNSGEWAFDTALVDVTPGGAQTESFGGTTIQENTFQVAGPFDLDADAGTGLGVGYDVVLDCDQDAELSDGDYIDGLSNEAGMYAVHDTTEDGPLAVTELLYSIDSTVGASFGIPSNKLAEDLYYPTDIASMGQLPIIIISRGNGHVYTWYDHIGFHMASYGYIVMSHDNNTEPGVGPAAETTQGHTDAFIDQVEAGVIAGGDLVGHLDTSRITWIGHSRGGEGVTIAYDNIFSDGSYVPTHYSTDDIVLISSMAPTDFLGPNDANPHGANYHLWTASADADVSGVPSNDIAQTFHLHDRATGYRHSTCIQGAGHGDLHDGGGSSVASGPCLIGRPDTHLIQQGYFLPLIKYYAEGSIPAIDFLTRQWEQFKPIGAPDPGFCSATGGPAIVVNNTYRNGATDGKFVIDDFQSETSPGTSSSGGTVTATATNLTEDNLDDQDTSFTWSESDPMNGFTYGRSSDDTRGVVFDWDGEDLFYEQEIIVAERDFTDDLFLSFRAAQGTRHPNTVVVLEDLTFSVTLRDGNGTSSSINIGAYGGGLEEPYQRTGSGSGAGWGAEFETIRILLTDFLNNGSGLDLTDIVAVRFDVGPSWGSNEGRIGVDDIELTNDPPAFFTPLSINVPDGAPEFLSPGGPTVFDVEIFEGSDMLVEDSPTLHYRYELAGDFLTAPLTHVGGDLYQAVLPAPDCGQRPVFYVTAEGTVTGVVVEPPGAPALPFKGSVGDVTVILEDDFETDMGWTVESTDLEAGEWERGVPAGDGSGGDPTEDYDGSGQCQLTGNQVDVDVDGGPTRLISPTIDLTGTSGPILRYARWMACDDAGTAEEDFLEVEISDDNGASWTVVDTAEHTGAWVKWDIHLAPLGIDLNNQFKVRFSVEDNPNNSVTEAAIDAVKVFDVVCE